MARLPRSEVIDPNEPSMVHVINRTVVAKLAEARKRLSSVSWWVRLLNQRIAQRANRETDETGRFWQDRFRAIRIEDEESLLAYAAYIDLNPIHAAMAETIEDSEYTSQSSNAAPLPSPSTGTQTSSVASVNRSADRSNLASSLQHYATAAQSR